MNTKKITALLIFMSLFSSILTKAQNWETNFEQAQQLAKQQNKALILVFSGSDWCAPCMRLENEIWKSEEFQNYAKEHYILYRADFPRKKQNQPDEQQMKANKQLAEKYNRSGFFPFVVVFDTNGKVVGETGYKKMSPKEYINHLNSFLKQ